MALNKEHIQGLTGKYEVEGVVSKALSNGMNSTKIHRKPTKFVRELY